MSNLTGGLKKWLSRPKAYYLRFKHKGFKRFWREDIIASNDSPAKKAWSIALGVFIGFTPLYGIQTVIVLVLAGALRLNKVIALFFTYISLPPFIPFIMYGSLQLGAWILNAQENFSWKLVQKDFDVLAHLKYYVVGSLILSAVLSTVFAVVGYWWFSYKVQKTTTIYEP